MSTLSERLRALGVQLGAAELPVPKPLEKTYPLHTIFDVSVHSTIYGEAQYIQNDYLPNYQHGIVPFSMPAHYQIIYAWGGISRPTPKQNLLFLDTETTGLAGGTGTFAFLIGIGYWTEAGFRIIQFFLPEPQAELSFLVAFNEWVSGFDCLVTFNGKSFDLPLLNTRHVLNRLQIPFPQTAHLDLLHLARRLWRYRLNDRSLGSLEEEILRLPRGVQEIPGWMIPSLYLEYLQTHDARPLSGIFYHNQMDILSLAALFLYMGRLLDYPMHQEFSPPGLDWMAIARLYEDLKRPEMAINLYRASLDVGLPLPFYLDTCKRFASIYRRRQEWQKAIELWQSAAELGDVSSCIELSKYYEHQVQDSNEAFAWAQRAAQYQTSPEIEYRIRRIEKKLRNPK